MKSQMALWTAAAALASAPWTLAQSPADSWDNLRQLRAGQRIEVVDMKLRSFQGSFRTYSEEAITFLDGAKEISVGRNEIFRVNDRGSAHRGRNSLIGLALGAAGGAAIGAVTGATYHEEGETGVFMLVWTPIGAGVGAAAGAMIPSGQKTVYQARRPSQSGTSPPKR